MVEIIVLPYKGFYAHIGVDSGVARSTKKGKARASVCGTSNGYRLSTLFFYYGLFYILTVAQWGSGARK